MKQKYCLIDVNKKGINGLGDFIYELNSCNENIGGACFNECSTSDASVYTFYRHTYYLIGGY